jgi:beta-glucosidase
VQPGLPVIGMRLMGEPVASGDPLDDAVAAAAGADVAVVVVGASAQTETEGMDRPDLALVGDQDELVERVLAANPRTAVVLNAGAPVATPWADRAAAVAVAWYPGEEGAPALADVLTGAAEPGGRLPLTFPARVEDVPVHGEWYPGTDGRVVYGEGTLVGYRHYDTNGVAPAFCFGHGLGYTTFAYGDPEVTVDAEAGTATVGVPITNTGRRAGREVVQVYVHQPAPQRPEPDQVLGGFAVATVEAGATTVVPVVLHERAFSGWDDATGGWRRHAGPFELRIGSSSRAVHRTVAVELSAG